MHTIINQNIHSDTNPIKAAAAVVPHSRNKRKVKVKEMFKWILLYQ